MPRQDAAAGPRRRSVLTGALGIAALALTGCGIRLDRDPQLPDLSPVDVLRDAVARSLGAIDPEAGTGAPQEVRDALETFARAVGPAWNPPADLDEPVDAPNPDPASMDATDGLTDVASRIVDALSGLGTTTDATTAVLLDVATGALLHLDDLDTEAAQEIRTSLAAAQSAVLEAAEETAIDASASPESADADAAGDASAAADGDDADHPLTALALACYAAEYAYERAAVHLDLSDPARSAAANRLDRLHGIVAAAGALVPDLAMPSDRPAWDLSEDPTDADSARTALCAAEDSVAAALLAARESVPPAAFGSWLDDSARARSRARGAQDLRFEVAAQTQEDDA